MELSRGCLSPQALPSCGCSVGTHIGGPQAGVTPHCTDEGPEAQGQVVTQMQDSTLVGFPGPVLFLFSLNMRQTSLGLSLATRDKGMSSISGARCLLGARGPSLEEGEGHRRLLFLSLPPLALAPEETSAEEGTTRPSRGQCDAGHVLPPAVLVSSISLVTSHSVDGELRPVPPPLRSRLSLPGWENPAPGSVLNVPLPPSPAHSPPQALVL